MPALGLTDHGVMNGAVEHYKACREAGIKPIIGVEAYLVDDRKATPAQPRYERNHLTLLAQSDTGFRNLVKLSSAGFLEGFSRGKANVDMELLASPLRGRDRADRLPAVALLPPPRRGPPRGRPRPRRRPDPGLRPRAGLLRGPAQRRAPSRTRPTRGSSASPRELGRPLVATADVHYLRREDYDSHAALLCVQTKSTIEQPKLRFDTNEFYLKSPEEMSESFSDLPRRSRRPPRSRSGARSRWSSASCCCRASRPRREWSRGRCCASWPLRGWRGATATRSPAEARERLDFELGVISEMGFESYFLIVWDFVRYAKESGIAVGPGRGSAAGSIVAYALEITDIDPLANGLLFERFLNPGRKSMPDIDIDFSVRGRERVIRYVAEKYGRDRVAQIITFGKMAPRAATRDAARVLGYDYGTGDKLAKQIPEPILGRNPSFDDCLKAGEELKRTYDSDPDAQADPRHRAGARGDRPQPLDPRRGGGDRRPAAPGDRAAPARRGPGAARRATATGTGTAGKGGAGLQDRDPVLDGPDRGDRPAEDGLPRAAQPGRDRGRGGDRRALPRRADRDQGHPARRPQDLRDALPRRVDRRLPVRVRRDARRAPDGEADRVPGPGRAGLPLPARGDALHRRLREGQARPDSVVATRTRGMRPDHRVHLRLRDLPGAADGDRQADGRLQPGRGRRPAQGGRQEEARPDGDDEGQVPGGPGGVGDRDRASPRTSGR